MDCCVPFDIIRYTLSCIVVYHKAWNKSTHCEYYNQKVVTDKNRDMKCLMSGAFPVQKKHKGATSTIVPIVEVTLILNPFSSYCFIGQLHPDPDNIPEPECF